VRVGISHDADEFCDLASKFDITGIPDTWCIYSREDWSVIVLVIFFCRIIIGVVGPREYGLKVLVGAPDFFEASMRAIRWSL
jgi:hypothetical protein